MPGMTKEIQRICQCSKTRLNIIISQIRYNYLFLTHMSHVHLLDSGLFVCASCFEFEQLVFVLPRRLLRSTDAGARRFSKSPTNPSNVREPNHINSYDATLRYNSTNTYSYYVGRIRAPIITTYQIIATYNELGIKTCTESILIIA